VTVRFSAAVLILASAAAVAAWQQPRFSSGAEAVQVDVEVRSGNRPVAGLTASDFELRDSGVPQTIRVVSFESVPVSIMLALDVSSSVKGEAIAHLEDAARAVVRALTPQDEAALLAFSERVSLKSAWTRDRDVLMRAIDRLEASGATALHDGLFTAMSLRGDASGRILVLAFTDGLDTASWLEPTAVLDAARSTDVLVYGVSVASSFTAHGANESAIMLRQRPALHRWFDTDPTLFPHMLLEKVADTTGGEMVYLNTTRDLTATFTSIIAGFKQRYLIAYTPTGAPAKGWHPIEVRVKGRRADVRARRGYSR
jgi:VWFA-related protein